MGNRKAAVNRGAGSFGIGDRATDIEAGAAASLPSFLFAGGDLDAFVTEILKQVRVS